MQADKSVLRPPMFLVLVLAESDNIKNQKQGLVRHVLMHTLQADKSLPIILTHVVGKPDDIRNSCLCIKSVLV